jgi:hypothetical protein
MHSESLNDEVAEGDKVLGPIQDDNISENDSVVEEKGKRGGVRREKKILPDVSKNLYRDVPTNLHPIVPFVNMRLGRSTAGGAYSLWLKLLNLEGYEFIDAEGKTFAEIGNKGIKSTPGKCNGNMHRWECTSPTCEWFVFIRYNVDNGWFVEDRNLAHNNCGSVAKNSAKVLKRKLGDKVHVDTTKTADIRTSASESKLGDISYKMAQRVMRGIKEEKRGLWSDGFTFLPSCMENLRRNNPTSIIELETARLRYYLGELDTHHPSAAQDAHR